MLTIVCSQRVVILRAFSILSFVTNSSRLDFDERVEECLQSKLRADACVLVFI